MVNVENIRKVIEMIKNENNYFNMVDWDLDVTCLRGENIVYPENVCGTPSCIGGWAEGIMRFEGVHTEDCTTSKVGDWLGISDEQAYSLFYPFVPSGMENITREQAVAHLEYIAETGEINWDLFVPEMAEHNGKGWSE